MLVRREYVESMGGMRFLGQWLAEDAVLGEQVRTLGGRIELSPHIVELEAASMRWGDWWRRQRRLAVTYKIVARGGYFGSILVMPGAWAWLLLAMGRVDWAMGVLAFRALSLCGGLVFFKEQAKGHLALVLPLVMMMEPIFWALAWLRGGSVVWGKSRKVDEDGRLN